ncbi:hypothetical protein ABT160_14015 [Streptomyces sp. NPDC001941]|uniref:hypothetical protein n=1 Tax=Streptomyces sp. NPDC001941 TaxID=3154659 RepID=UPI0033165102
MTTRSRAALGAASVLALALLTACSDGGGRAEPSAPTSRPPTSAAPSPTSPTTAPSWQASPSQAPGPAPAESSPETLPSSQVRSPKGKPLRSYDPAAKAKAKRPSRKH